jgi:hypothetical protein
MDFAEKLAHLVTAKCVMQSSKQLCLSDAKRLLKEGRIADAHDRLEKAARYAWGFNRPDGWNG